MKSLWVDTMGMTVRADVPVATLRFFTVLEDAQQEACRIQTNVPHLKRMVDVICRSINYYPTKKTGK